MKFRLVPALLILLVMIVTVRLGFWQRDRAHQKEALEAQVTQFEHAPAQPVGTAPVELKDIEFHRVKARGRFVADKVVYLDNRPYNDQPGFYVVMPFKLADGGYVLVNRGWLPRNMSNRETIAPYRTPDGEIEIEGIARADASRAFELGSGGSAAHQLIRQNLDTAAYAAETGLPLRPFVIQQLSDDGDKLVRDWPAPTEGVERNYGYMFQWWGMAAAALAFGLYAARRAAKKEHVPGVYAAHAAARPGTGLQATQSLKEVHVVSTQSPRSPQARQSAATASPGQAAPKAMPGQPNGKGSWQRGRWMLLLVAIVCGAPIAVSYFMYYVIKPTGGTTSYGTLVEPQRPIPDSLIVTGEDGNAVKLASLRGHWLMISADSSACDKACATKLYFMRQIRAAQGAERERVAAVWLRTDAANVSDVIKTAYPDTDRLIADPAQVSAWLPVDAGTKVTDHIYLVDPNGNLMMRFPKDPNPSKIRGDVTKLLKWSSIG